MKYIQLAALAAIFSLAFVGLAHAMENQERVFIKTEFGYLQTIDSPNEYEAKRKLFRDAGIIKSVECYEIPVTPVNCVENG